MLDVATELSKCEQSQVYFTNKYCQIKDDDGQWVLFRLWLDQAQAMRDFSVNKKVVALKARQIGMTWLALAYALHLMIFNPGITVLLFSLREKEAIEILNRLKEMYNHLPDWLKFQNGKTDGNKTSFELPNDSRALAFPSGTGDSYTAKLAIIDEADLIGMDLGRMINSVQPTIEAGGQLILISKSNKEVTDSPFKRIYRAARNGESDWKSIFLSWKSRPNRTQAWYDNLKRSKFAETGSNDFIHENYPNTDDEALAPSASGQRIPSEWINQCMRRMPHFTELPPSLRFIQGLRIYREVTPYRTYVIGADPAEGNPNSDDSAVMVLDQDNGEEVASYAGKVPPRRLGEFCKALAKYYNRAATLVERNNHGHAFILWWEDNAGGYPLLNGLDGKSGWHENRKNKTQLFVNAADMFRDNQIVLHTQKAADQLQLIGGTTLKAPEGDYDDLAMACVLVMMAAVISTYSVPQTSRREEIVQPPSHAFGVISHPSSMPFGVRSR